VRWPNSYMDEERGMEFWNEVMTILKTSTYEVEL